MAATVRLAEGTPWLILFLSLADSNIEENRVVPQFEISRLTFSRPAPEFLG
jgi:hypothetical protein